MCIEDVASPRFLEGIARSGMSRGQLDRYFDMLEKYFRSGGCDQRRGLPDGFVRQIRERVVAEDGIRDGGRLLGNGVSVFGGGVEDTVRFGGTAALPCADGHGLGSVSGVGDGVGRLSVAAESGGSREVEGHRGPNWGRNQEWKKVKKERKLKKKNLAGRDWRKVESNEAVVDGNMSFWKSCTDVKRKELIDSKAEKHIAENKRDAERARRQLAVFESNGVEVDAKKYEKCVQASIERSMVSIERAHGTLRATGNVPGFVGSAETLLGSGSISPNSSVSEAEVRNMQKKLLDQEALIKKLEDHCGMTSDMLPFADKSVWTDNSVNDDLLDRNCPDGYAKDFHGRVDGKFRVIVA